MSVRHQKACQGTRFRRQILHPVAALFLASCGADAGEAEGGAVRVEPLEVPAAAPAEEPSLASDGGRVVLSWLELPDDGAPTLRMSRLEDGGWTPAVSIVSDERLLANWADFPSVVPLGNDLTAAHWMVRGGQGGYDYGIRAAFSSDGGRTWSEPWIPHEDGTPTEHGFVSFVAGEAAPAGLVWLDGRDYARAEAEGADDARMTLRYREGGPSGPMGDAAVLVDDLVCDCCQTDAASTSAGPVVVYRDRTEDEVRDVYLTRRVEGAWTEGRPVHDDGWITPACPVNGPAVAAAGDRVVVAWFTAAGDVPRVRAAFSQDGGASFGPPVDVDDGDPVGRVDVVLLGDGSALVSWLEGVPGGAEVRIRRLGTDGPGPSTAVATSSAARRSGFPRMAVEPGGAVLLAWTDAVEGTIRALRVHAGPSPAEEAP